MAQLGRGRLGVARLATALYLAGAIGLSAGVAAQEPEKGAKRPAEEGDQSLKLSPVVVTATRVEEKSFDIPASIDTVGRDVIGEKKPQVLISEDIQRLPGTVVQNRGTFSQEEQIIIRGFGARSQFGTRGVKLFSDGIPTSTPDGQGSSAVFDLSSAERIEVLRGAFSALYGNHSGGVVQVFTRDGPPQPTLSGRVTLGSYDTSVVGLQFGGTAGSADYIGSASRFDTDGYRVWSGARKDQFNGKANLGLPNGGKLSLVLNYLDQHNNLDPGGLTAAQVALDPIQASANALAFKTRRNLDNQQGGVIYRQDVTPRDSLQVIGYLGSRSNEQYLGIPLGAQNAITAAGGVSTFDRNSRGARGWWTHRDEVGGGSLTFTAGGEYEYGREDRTGYLNNFGAIAPVAGVQGVLKRNEENTTDSWGVFAQGEWQFLPDWGLTVGLRYTEVKFESDDRFICTTAVNTTGTPLGRCSGSSLAVTATRFNPDDSGSITHDAWTPVAGLLYRLSPSTNLYANLGKSFETPTLAELAYRADGGAGLNFALNPSTSWQYEAGAKTFVGNDTRINLALFYIDTDDEVVVATNAGGRSTFQNAPGTRRSGAELAIDSFLGWGFSGYLSATYLNAEFTDAFRTANLGPIVNSGNNVPGVPNYTVYGQLSWNYAPLGFTAGLEAYWQGKVYVDDLNTETAPKYWLANVTAGFQQKWGGLVLSEFLRVNNLFDEDYISAIAVNNANRQFYYPGTDRNYLVGITASYQF